MREIFNFLAECFIRGLYVFIVALIPVWSICEIRDKYKDWKKKRNETWKNRKS